MYDDLITTLSLSYDEVEVIKSALEMYYERTNDYEDRIVEGIFEKLN